MVEIRIPEDLAAFIEEGAQRSSKHYAEFLREAVLSQLEDLEDIAIVTEYLCNPGDTISMNEMNKNLGLDV